MGLPEVGEEKYSITPSHAKHLSETPRPNTRSKPKEQPTKKSITPYNPPQKNSDQSPNPIKKPFPITKSNYNTIIQQWKKTIDQYLQILKSKAFVITNLDAKYPLNPYKRLYADTEKLIFTTTKNNNVIKTIEISLIPIEMNQLYFQTILAPEKKDLTNNNPNFNKIKDLYKEIPQIIEDFNHHKATIIGLK